MASKIPIRREGKILAHGIYPDVSLKQARERRDEARKLLAEGIDPGENRKVQRAAKQEQAGNSFEVIACEWFSKHSPNWAHYLHVGHRELCQ